MKSDALSDNVFDLCTYAMYIMLCSCIECYGYITIMYYYVYDFIMFILLFILNCSCSFILYTIGM